MAAIHKKEKCFINEDENDNYNRRQAPSKVIIFLKV